MNGRLISSLAFLLASFAFLYRNVAVDLVRDWSEMADYSHGFFVIPVALYLAWERKAKFLAAARRPSYWGLPLVLGSLAVLFVGLLGVEFFITRLSILGVITGAILFLCGWEHLKIMRFPIAFLLLMIPIPAIVFNQLAFPLRLIASRFGELTLAACQIPVLRDGNLIVLGNTRMEVADACSGISSLVSLLGGGIVYGYFLESRVSVRVAIALATVPIAIFANSFRVAGTGLAARVYGPEAAEGFFHMFSGWLVFTAAFVMLLVFHRVLVLVFPEKIGRPENSPPAA